MAQHTDKSGTTYTSTTKPTYGTPATSTIGGNKVNGTVQGGGYFVPNKK